MCYTMHALLKYLSIENNTKQEHHNSMNRLYLFHIEWVLREFNHRNRSEGVDRFYHGLVIESRDDAKKFLPHEKMLTKTTPW